MAPAAPIRKSASRLKAIDNPTLRPRECIRTRIINAAMQKDKRRSVAVDDALTYTVTTQCVSPVDCFLHTSSFVSQFRQLLFTRSIQNVLWRSSAIYASLYSHSFGERTSGFRIADAATTWTKRTHTTIQWVIL